MSRIRSIVAATTNPGKLREMEKLIDVPGLQMLSLADFPDLTEVEETGNSFVANAVLKARGYALQMAAWTLADDSGLEVEILDGRPGVHSARFGGPQTSWKDKLVLLLEQIDAAGKDHRRARFVCAMSVSDDQGQIRISSTGVCEGKIGLVARGRHGFGYDPLFIPEGFDRTFGELSDDIKQQISHRAVASEAIKRFFLDFTAL
ncbi:MAG: RdgB/HAM1 family non-canonical purine NTP pyrophosphatase [Acidobacteriota bacterium]